MAYFSGKFAKSYQFLVHIYIKDPLRLTFNLLKQLQFYYSQPYKIFNNPGATTTTKISPKTSQNIQISITNWCHIWLFKQLKNCPYPPHRRLLEIPQGWGISKAKLFSEYMKLNCLEILYGWGKESIFLGTMKYWFSHLLIPLLAFLQMKQTFKATHAQNVFIYRYINFCQKRPNQSA